MTGHSPAGSVDIKFPALCKHISRNGTNKGDPFPRTKQKGQWGQKDDEDRFWGRESWPNGPSNQLFVVKAEPVSQPFSHHFQNFCLYSLLGPPTLYCVAADKGETEELW